MTSSVIKTESGMAITGKFVFDTITELLTTGSHCINEHSNINSIFEITCDDLQRVDSAGIATFVEWQRQSKEAGFKLCFNGMPKQSQSLIEAYRLRSIILA